VMKVWKSASKGVMRVVALSTCASPNTVLRVDIPRSKRPSSPIWELLQKVADQGRELGRLFDAGDMAHPVEKLEARAKNCFGTGLDKRNRRSPVIFTSNDQCTRGN